jgi:hypothetical protein
MRLRNTSLAFAPALGLLAAMCVGATVASTAGASAAGASAAAASAASPRAVAATTQTSFLGGLHIVSQVASTVPSNGDVNPYGVAVVTASIGSLTAGDTLVSNFNDKTNVQGTGNTIVQISPSGARQVFSQVSGLPAGERCPGGVGLTTALAILPGGWVVVGSLPTGKDGSLPSVDPAGCLIVLNDYGKPVESITNKDIVAPWDLAMTATATTAELFVSNALGGNTSTEHGLPFEGNCAVERINLALSATSAPAVTSSTVIGTDFPWEANKAALVLAPTGLALGHNGTLYVDDSETNKISAVPDALTRTTAVRASATVISSGGALDAPLGMTLVANGDLVVVNGNNGNAVELSPAGKQLVTKTLVKNGAGDLFGLAPTTTGEALLFVNDGTNALDIYKP